MSTEKLLLVDKRNGQIKLSHSDKNADSVYVDSQTIRNINKQVKNNLIATHNHPVLTVGKFDIPISFSPEDIYNAISLNLAGIRAVDAFYTYIIKRPKNGWPKIKSKKEFMSDLYKIDEKLRKKYQKDVNSGKMSLVTYRRNFSHWIAREMCKSLGLPYVRLRNGVKRTSMKITKKPDWYKPKKGL